MEMKIGAILVVLFVALAVKALDYLWLKPKKLEKLLRKQGFCGNPYRLFIGDMKDFAKIMKVEQPRPIHLSDDLIAHILPYYHQIMGKYGKRSFVWFGPTPTLIITDPELMKDILTKPGVFHKPSPDPIGETVAGGILFLEDEKWARHRKIVNPAFHMEKLKSMIGAMYLSCSNMIANWEVLVSGSESSREIDVWPYLEDLSGDVISRTAFGSSHEEGRKIFELQKEQVKLVMQLLHLFFFPAWSYVPTKLNRRMNWLTKEIQTLLRGIVSQREKEMERGEATNDDLLGMLMESNLKEIEENVNKNTGMSIEDVIKECKLFYFAGSETTANLLAWTMVLLCKHQDWQARAREEVLQVFGTKEPTFDGLNQLKVVTMIFQEVLRLYPPAPLIFRAATKAVKLGDAILPKGVHLALLIGVMHHDPDIWCPDANEFNPLRFWGGISNATKMPFSFIPFSAGPRICVGQNFAMVEVKMALTMILQHFSFEFSSSYVHAPFAIFTLQPQHGVRLILHKL